MPHDKSSKMHRIGAVSRALLMSAALVFPALGGNAIAKPSAPLPSPASKRMNVLFIIADDLRVGSAFDTREVRMPNVDALAAKGVRFTQAQTQFPLCGPSRASFLSGLRPNTVKVYDLDTSIRGNKPDLVTMPQYFRQNGYFTAAVGKLHHQGVPGTIGLPPEKDPHHDPLSWDEAYKPIGVDKEIEWDDKLINPSHFHPGIAMAWYADPSGKPHTDDLVADKTIELIQRNKDHPFFIAAGFYRPHVPEVAPKSYFDQYAHIKWKPETHADTSGVKRKELDQGLTVDQEREFVRGYYASMSFMDAQVGRILAGLEKSGVADRTIVVFTSDHGFNLGEHGHWEKTVLWRQSTEVPLVIYAPKARGNGQTAAQPVELVDLYQTLADMAGLPAPVGPEGRSLRPLIENPKSKTWNYPAQSQVINGRSVRYAQWRYSEWGANGSDGIELYDLSKDPGEYRNLAKLPRYTATIAKLKPMLPAPAPLSTAPKVSNEGQLYQFVPGGRQHMPANWPK